MYKNKFKFTAFFLIFFQIYFMSAEREAVKNSGVSKISRPIISYAKSFIEDRKRGDFFEMPFIAITGCSAVGKTEFAKGLKIEFEKENIAVEILKQDDFIRPNKVNIGNFAHSWLNHQEMHRVINEIKNGKLIISRPKFDWRYQTVSYEELDLTAVDIILYEGIYVLNTDVPYDFGRYSNIKIFIDAAKEDIIEWDWKREKDYLNACCIPMTKDSFGRGVARIMRDYRKNILPKKKTVDFIVEKDKNHNYSLIINR